jgi:hypothetical protein
MIYRSNGFYRYRKGGIEFVPLQSERHPVIQTLIDVLCIAWWCLFSSTAAIAVVWAMFVLGFVIVWYRLS